MELWNKAFEALAKEQFHTHHNYLFVDTDGQIVGCLLSCSLSLESDGDGLLYFTATQSEFGHTKKKVRKRKLKGRVLRALDYDVHTHVVRMYQVRIDQTGPWK
jgi:hypothetical protein